MSGFKSEPYTNYVLVEPVHTPQGPRQKSICSSARAASDRNSWPASDWNWWLVSSESAFVFAKTGALSSIGP